MADDRVSEGLIYEPYTTRSGMSLSANLREAFRTSPLLQRPVTSAQVLIDSPVMLMPIEEFEQDDAPALYRHAYPHLASYTVLHTVLPDLAAVALYSAPSDLLLVINDHYADPRLMPVEIAVWHYMLHRSHTSQNRKLYAYFHDQRMSLFAFTTQDRFAFHCTYDATSPHDTIFYMLAVWQQLAMDAERDELHLSGLVPQPPQTVETLHRYLQRVYTVRPAAELNRAPITRIPLLPLDTMLLYTNKR